MNPKRSFLIIGLSCLLTLFAFQVVAAEKTAPPSAPVAKPRATSSIRTPQGNTPPGYCCKKGQFSSSTETDCQKVRGSYFATKREAEAGCTGFCCDGGTVSNITKAKCSRQRGTFYDNFKDAEKRCAQDSGFCCKDGEISKSTTKTCEKERGTFYRSEQMAAKNCLGYCCADFAVSQTTKEKCKSVRGKYYIKKQQADRFCESQKGICCIEGQTHRLTKRECKTKRGEFYSSKQSAVKECRQESGFCNHGGRTFRLTQEQCDKRKGSYFTSQVLARKALVNSQRQELTEKKSVKRLSPVDRKAVGVASPLALKKKPGNIPTPPGPDMDRDPRDSGHSDLVLTLSIELPEQDGSWSSPTATINVTNIGDQATSAETTVDLFLSDQPNLYYGRTLIPFWTKMVPELEPNMTHSISHTFNISETWTLPGTQTSHTILPGTFRLVSHLNTELLPLGEERGEGANNDEVIFEYSGQTGFYDLAMLGVKLTGDNRLNIHLRNLGADISQLRFDQMDVAVSIDGGAFKRIKLATVDPQGVLRAGPLDSPSAPPKYIFTWPLPAQAGGDGLAPFATGTRHQITARVGQHAYNNNVHFGYDSRPGNNERVNYAGGTPDLVVCFKKTNLSKTAMYSYYPPRVKNIGNAPSGPANLRFWIEDKGAENYTVPSLPIGGEHSIQRKVWWILKGVRRFTLMVDNNTEVEEGPGESNNIIAGNICVSALTYTIYDEQGCVNSETLCSDAPGMADN